MRTTQQSRSLQGNDPSNNTFFGGEGDDVLISAASQSSTSTGADSDTFIYRLGDGNDTIYDAGTLKADVDTLVLQGINEQDVTLHLSQGNILVKFAQNDEFITLQKHGGIDQFIFGDGKIWNSADILYWANQGSGFYAGTSGADTIIGSEFDQSISGAEGNDYIDGKGGSDEIHGDQGNDTIAITISAPGDLDEIEGGDNTDTLTLENFTSAVFVDLVLNDGEVRTSDASSRPDQTDRLIATVLRIENVTGSKFDDHILGGDADNVLLGNAGDDIIDGRSGKDTLNGGDGNDSLSGYIGVDTLLGMAGDDYLSGGLDNDSMEGGAGSDVLEGGAGNDTYTFGVGDGSDQILELSDGGTADTIRLKGISDADVSFERQLDDLVISIASANVSITLKKPSTGYKEYDQYGIEKIVFDNLTWDADDLRQRSVYASATDGNDVLVGSAASGVFGGGKGNDTLTGGDGSDTYLYARGDGNDTIIETSLYFGTGDRLRFTDIISTNVSLSRNGNDLTVSIPESSGGAGDGGTILVKGTLDVYSEMGVEFFDFADGVTWSIAQVREMLLMSAATSGNDVITGFNTADTLEGKGGNDTLSGADGSDIYLYSRGDGADTIVETGTNQGTEELRFSNITSAGIQLVRAGTDLTLVVKESAPGAGDGGSILVKETLDVNSQRGVEVFKFSDGVTWSIAQVREILLTNAANGGNDNITGFNTADTLEGKGGNDTLAGGIGADIYLYARGDGLDTIVEGGTNQGIDELRFSNVSSTSVQLVRAGNDVTLAINESAPGANDGGSILVKETLDLSNQAGVEVFKFSDGVTWSIAQVRETLLVNAATAGNDTITGFNTPDTLQGKGGNDTLTGGSGNDIYIYARGDGNDTIVETGQTREALTS